MPQNRLKFKLYCSSAVIPSDSPKNHGFEEVMYQLWIIEKKNIADVEIIDCAGLPDEQRQLAYESAIPSSIRTKMGIRYVFGTKHRSNFRFGKEIPALLVYLVGRDLPVDIFPSSPERGMVTTINDVLWTVLRRRTTWQPISNRS